MQTQVIPHMLMMCFLAILCAVINYSVAVPCFVLFFLLCHQVYGFTSCGLRPENTWGEWVKTGISKNWHFLFPLSPPQPPMERPGVNGFQLLEAGGWVMGVLLYGPLWARCVSAAQWGPDEGYEWGLFNWTATAVKLYFNRDGCYSVTFS